MSPDRHRRTVVLGYGNPGRRDDGLGPAAAAALEARPVPGVEVEAAYQLNIEDAATIAEYGKAIFVDAAVSGPEPYELRPVSPASTIAFTSHSMDPASVLAICEESFCPAPEAWVLAIRGYDFALGEGLTPRAEENLNAALDAVRALLQVKEDRTHGCRTAHKNHTDH